MRIMQVKVLFPITLKQIYIGAEELKLDQWEEKQNL